MSKGSKLGEMPMGKLVFSMSLPLMISLLVQSLYNIVGSIFVARLSETALSATSLAYIRPALMHLVYPSVFYHSNTAFFSFFRQSEQRVFPWKEYVHAHLHFLLYR